ncbi:MAG: nucleoside recognition protein [Candidatus Marinimicrobia bacterium]|nr:nucleoside recognition protein [Candidatus Neomarinimicrobiota bacterium]
MLNYIWFGMIAISVLVGIISGNLDAVTEAAFDSARKAVDLAIGLIGIMALWLGIMKIAEKAGLVSALARGIRPLARWLFPDIPDGHPALGSIVLNMAANMLGLGNAATPMGLKAMKELQDLNPVDGTATNAMVTFLAINTSSVQILLPATVVGLMGAASAAIFIPVLLASTVSTVVAIVAARWLEKRRAYAVVVSEPGGEEQ